MFNDTEARILENHGYHETHNRVMRSLPGLIRNPTYKPITPHPEWQDESRLSTALNVRTKTAEWVEIYNHHRPHAWLGGSPPSEFLAKHLTGNVYS